ncbi:unnamed protein product, partial [Phaeothamnion confervicola]
RKHIRHRISVTRTERTPGRGTLKDSMRVGFDVHSPKTRLRSACIPRPPAVTPVRGENGVANSVAAGIALVIVGLVLGRATVETDLRKIGRQCLAIQHKALLAASFVAIVALYFVLIYWPMSVLANDTGRQSQSERRRSRSDPARFAKMGELHIPRAGVT